MKSYKRVASAVLGMAMAASCMAPITRCRGFSAAH